MTRKEIQDQLDTAAEIETARITRPKARRIKAPRTAKARNEAQSNRGLLQAWNQNLGGRKMYMYVCLAIVLLKCLWLNYYNLRHIADMEERLSRLEKKHDR